MEDLDGDGNWVTVIKTPYAFIGDYDRLCISGEEGDSLLDYYGEYRDGCPYICSELEAWAAKHGGFWEWLNPGAIMFCEA